MRTRSVVLLALALGCGLIAAVGINQVMANRKTESKPTGEMKPIFVATTDISPGDLITPKSVKLEEWPVGKVPEGALSKVEEIDGRRARVKVFAGDVLRENKLFNKGETGHLATELIPAGYRVVAVEADEVAAGGALIRPGDRVDVLVHMERNPHKGVENTTTQTILQDIKVFAVGDVYTLDPGRDDDKSLSAKTISLLVTPEQAQKLTMASEMGKIRLTLRSHADSLQSQLDPTSPTFLHRLEQGASRLEESLFKAEKDTSKKSGLLDFLGQLSKEPNEATQPPAEPETPKTEAWTMRVLSGQEVADVRMQRSPGERNLWTTVSAELEPAIPAAPVPPTAQVPTTEGLDSEGQSPLSPQAPDESQESDSEESNQF